MSNAPFGLLYCERHWHARTRAWSDREVCLVLHAGQSPSDAEVNCDCLTGEGDVRLELKSDPIGVYREINPKCQWDIPPAQNSYKLQ